MTAVPGVGAVAAVAGRQVKLFATNFSEYETGSPPSGWTARGSTAFAWTITSGGNEGGRLAEHTTSSSSPTGLAVLSWNGKDAAKCEVLALLRNADPNGTDRSFGGVILRGSGTSTVSGYVVQFRRLSSTPRVDLHKIAGTAAAIGADSGVASITSGMGTETAWRYLRVRAEGNNIKVRHWLYGNEEPGTWGINYNDPSAPYLDPGFVGLIDTQQRTDSDVEWDFFSVAIGGFGAPTP